MNNVTVSMWVHPDNEFKFFTHLKIIDSLSFDNISNKNPYTWNTEDIKISKFITPNWTCVNIPFETYLKFSASWNYNLGK
jgi:hypothetical protein